MTLNRLISFIELRRIASELKIPNVSRYSKEELIKKIESVDKELIDRKVNKLKRKYF